MTSLDILCRLVATFIIRMKFHKNKFLTTVAAAALALAVGACSSSSDDDEASLLNDTPPASGGGTGGTGGTGGSAPAAPTLASVQADAATAATDAQTAATAAKTAADAAELARANRAAIQTGDFHAGNSGELADKAQEHADAAQLAADAAKTASDAAAAATDMVAATRALVMAEASKMASGNQHTYAEMAQASAMTAAAGEIKIVDKTKTVGDTSITIDEMTHTSEINGVKKLTGLLDDEKITTPGVAIEVTPAVSEQEVIDDPTLTAAAAIPGAVVRDVEIGFTYDSAADSARVTLVNSYAGTKTVTAFARSNTPLTGAKAGMVDTIDHDDDNSTDAVSLPLKAATGSFYRASNIESGTIGAMEKATPLLYYETAAGKVYVESTGTSEVTDQEGVFQYNYQMVAIRSGAEIPYVAAYSHLHFGVWSGLDEADKDGLNALDDLGIGFVAGLSDMTAEMPNFGDADFKGNWVANVQAADGDGDGDITRHDGVASMNANFGKGEVDVILTGLATLDGTIDGNTFSGTKAALLNDAEVMEEAADSLSGKFAGNFSGAFFGTLAAEAGGVFDFASDDDNDGANEGGAFRGAFGADQK